MSKSKKITIILCSILFAFLGFFGIFLANKNDSVVKADTITSNYVFYGSGIFTPVTPKINNTPGSGFINAAYSAYFIPSVIQKSSNGNVLIDFSYIFSNVNGVNPPSNFASSYTSTFEFARDGWHNCVLNLPGTSRWLEFAVHCSSDFNFNINRIGIKYDSSFAGNSSLYCTIITFAAEVGAFDLLIPYYNVGNTSYAYLDRVYYLGSSFSDNQFYQTGYDNGYDVGYSAGDSAGYDNGYNVGYSAGDSAGYNRGVESANDYTFLGLIGATIDAPINAFTSFFDFELLGVNLKDFFFAILTFALVIVIVRFALAR